LVGVHDGLHPRGAVALHRIAGHFLRQTRQKGRHPAHVGGVGKLAHTAQDDLFHVGGLQVVAFDQFLHDRGGHVLRRHVLQGPAQVADGRPRPVHDDHFFHVTPLSPQSSPSTQSGKFFLENQSSVNFMAFVYFVVMIFSFSLFLPRPTAVSASSPPCSWAGIPGTPLPWAPCTWPACPCRSRSSPGPRPFGPVSGRYRP